MTIQEFLSDPIVRLPKSLPSNKEFNEYLCDLLNQYQRKVEKLEFPEELKNTNTLERVHDIINGIKGAIKRYYEGSPFDAYRRLRNAIKKSNLNEYWKGINIKDQRNFYRLRIKNSNYPLSKENLFHIPFNQRRKVATQRYSIPGFPSLYLSNSIYTAWEEIRRPNLDQIQAVRFVNQQPLNLIDLTNERYLGGSKMQPIETLLVDLIMWPLIASCSIKVKEPEQNFKPEYIIPQLLLQWIRNNHSVHGIKFSSTHIDLNEIKSVGTFFNIVIPVKENKEKGYCDIVSKMFKMTDVLSWQLNQFSVGAPGVVYSYDGKDLDKQDVKRIELVKNKIFPYDFSPLSSLELSLCEMKLHEIKFN